MVLAAAGKQIDRELWAGDFSTREGEGRRHIRGMGSSVLIDETEGVVLKAYKPGRLIRTMYWLAFQARFPYESNADALRAAELRREIADLVLEYEMMPGLVAQAYEAGETAPGIATEFVRGTAPRDARKAKGFLKYVTSAFLRAGLPTWQVAPWQPKASGNLIEGGDWDYRIIDLESNLVSPFVPLSQIGELLEQAIWPAFDDINLKRLKGYLAKHERPLVQRLGAAHAARLHEAAAEYEFYAQRWYDSEPRILSRTLKYAYKVAILPLALAGSIRRFASKVGKAADMAESEVIETIERRQDDGALTPVRAIAAIEAARIPAGQHALRHVAARRFVSASLPRPLGPIAAVFYTAISRLRAELLWLNGRKAEAALGLQTLTLSTAFGRSPAALDSNADLLAAVKAGPAFKDGQNSKITPLATRSMRRTTAL